jgi:radical SAM superfamily enzyme YgiQ (UPF0313 family)
MNRKLREKVEYLLSKEKGTVFKDPGGKLNIALVYPNKYSVGMSSLGFQGIYGLLNGIHDVVCERVFLPSEDDIQEYERSRTELFAFESKRPLARFDIVAFSVSFENDYPNIVKVLRLSRIPLKSRERRQSDPLVVMGGVCAFYNPEPLADFFDICFIGEAEDMLPEFLSAYRASGSKDELYRKILGIEGIYVPGLYSVDYSEKTGLITGRKATGGAPVTITKRTTGDISTAVKPLITTPEAEFSDMYLLEAMRGCPWSCRFCVAGHIYKPVRKKDPHLLKSEIGEILSRTSRVGLIGPSLSDYPDVEEILGIEGVDFSITSLRASPRTGNIVRLLKGHKSVSIAPEAGTERLRKVINKKITEEDILGAATLILGGEIETLRLYFMIGLPTETGEDIEGIIRLVGKIRQVTGKGFITVSVSTFVPKPFTPFQWHPMTPIREVKERLKVIKRGLSAMKGVRVFHDVPKYAYLQGVLSMGDRRTGKLVEALSEGAYSPSRRREAGIDEDFYIFRKKDFSEILPWDFIDTGVSGARLREEYLKATGG